MKPRSVLKILLAVVIVVAATLSTAGAALVWSEDRAHSDYLGAQSGVDSSLVQASAAGMLPEELAGFSAQADRLDSVHAPPSGLWSAKVTDFYQRQTRAYRALSDRINSDVARATSHAKAQAVWLLRKLHRDIGQARSLHMDTHYARWLWRNGMRSYSQGSTPRAYRGVVAALAGPESLIATNIKVRRSFIRAALAKSGHTQSGIVQMASAEASDSNGKLQLAALLSPKKAAHYNGKVDRLLSAVRDQTTPYRAAQKAADLHSVALQIDGLYSHTVPAKMVVVSTEAQFARVYQNGQEIYNTVVTTGGPELPTDHGVFHIYEKVSPFTFQSPWPPGSPFYYPPTPVTYWMPFDGGEGLHDAWWRSNFGPGSNLAPTNLGDGNVILGTHGCVNLPADAASFIWNWSDIGTTVIVV